MKRLLLFLCCCSVMVGCKESTGAGNDGKAPYFTIEAEQQTQNFLAVGEDGAAVEERAMAFKANIPVAAVSSDETWCTVKVLNGTTMNRITFFVTQNTNLSIRPEAIVTVTAEGCEPVQIKVNQLGEAPAILISEKKFSLDQYGGPITFEVTTNIDVTATSNEWIVKNAANKTMVKSTYSYTVATMGDGDADREGSITFTGTGVEPMVVQVIQTRDLTPEPIPAVDPNDFPGIVKLKLINPAMTQGRYNIDNPKQGPVGAIDGDKNAPNIFHSPFGAALGSDNPPLTAGEKVALEFEFENKNAAVNYVVITTRNSKVGLFTTGSIAYKTAAKPEWVKTYDIDMPLPVAISTDYKLDMPSIVEKPTHLQITMDAVISTNATEATAGVHYVTLAELEVFADGTIGALEPFMTTFTDQSLSKLKSGVSMLDVRKIENPTVRGIAVQLVQDIYPAEHVVEVAPSSTATDVPTGLSFKQDETALIFVGPTGGKKITLTTKNGSKKIVTNLLEGINKLDVKADTQATLVYTSSDADAKPITVHFANPTID